MIPAISRWRRWRTWLTNYEFWPFDVFYIPVYFYFTFLIIRCRSFFFFTASNPTFEFGGMLGEQKSELFKLIPEKYLPITQLFFPTSTSADVLSYAQQNGIRYPFILKPDIGERGWMVAKIKDKASLQAYLEKVKVPFLLQEYVEYPVELGVFYVRFPNQPYGTVTSIVKKGFLSVVGDGEHTVRELLRQNVRALLQVDFSSDFVQQIADQKPKKGEVLEVESIGNHCRGTTFLDFNHRISAALTAEINKLALSIPGFHFGRFDLRCKSLEDLEQGQNFKILELNGAGAEPGHVYQPGYSIFKAYRDICRHLSLLAKVSRQNHRLGVPYYSLRKGLKKMSEIRSYNRQKN
ncbi:MAG: hypothetical protein KI790_02770 [Cyclobacteriaceae bacterium]|nr:hypothetical protein [Cyclobacteriaceae bacterium HetDA_MAG_MS6]